jgi:hypothetical protein
MLVTNEPAVCRAMSPRLFQWPAIDGAARAQLVDMAIERYVDWREQSAAVSEAYENWSNATTAEGSLSFAAYLAELDREESAAALYASVIEQVERVLGAERELAGAESGAARR